MVVKILIIGFFILVKVGAFNEETCQPRPGPQNGQVSYTVRGGGLVARFRCQIGYKLKGSPFAICLSGVWRHPIPTCQPEGDLRAGSHRGVSRDPGPHDRALIRGKERDENYDLNDAPSGPSLITEPLKPQKNPKKNKGEKKKKGKRKAKHKKGRGATSDSQSLEKDSEFLSKLDLSCLIGTGGTGFIKAPEAAHAVIKYARKRNEGAPSNRYLLATYECAKGYHFKNDRNDRMFCSRSHWLGIKPKCLKIGGKSRTNGTEGLCSVERGGCEHICTEVRKKVVCSCYQGFRLEGTRCLDVDECEINNGGCEHTCTNQPGSFTCHCPTGLQLSSNGKTCVDINECLARNGHGPCQDRCTNHWGGYQCSCEGIPGTQLSEDKHTCERMDYCKSGSAGCSHSCINALGRAFCLCPVGWELGEDWKTCQDIDECDDEAVESSCEFGCVNTIGSYYCAKQETDTENEIKLVPEDLKTPVTCAPGYQTDSENKCVDVDECKENTHNCSHECINRQGSYECSCPDGYDLNDDERTCEDYDECADDMEMEHNCTQVCVNDIGSYHCECRAGYRLEADDVSCTDVDECELGVCSHDCVNEIGGFKCSCPEGFELRNETKCVDIDECLHQTVNCSHDCINLSGSYECGCPSGMVMSNDSITCDDVNECDYNNGNCSQLCKNEVGSYECECLTGYILKNKTECADVDECSDNDLNHCTYGCRNTPGSYVCYCPVGYILGVDDCEDINECLDFNGNCSHLCDNHEGSYACACPPGFALATDNRTCEDVNECLTDNGNCSHVCTNSEGSFKCDCPVGFRLLNSKTCEDIDECEDDNKIDGGCSDLCVNVPGSYHCDCLEGYRLTGDGTTCEDVNECADNNGNCSHVCANTDGGFECKCPENFDRHHDNRTCVKKDPCSGNGGCGQFCTAVDGKPVCSCHDGFEILDDGKSCGKRDDCTKCEQICDRRDDGVVCLCKAGFELQEDGFSCIDANECTSNPCSHICRNTVGGYECDCPDGYRISDLDKHACVDIDECTEWEYEADYYDNDIEGSGYSDFGQLCSQLCFNLPGGFYCDCRKGYILADDDRTCNDENECLTENGGCSHVCVNLEGRHECRCSRGYALSTDNRTCTDINECSQNNGNCSEVCENTAGSFRCGCQDGYILGEDGKTCHRDCTVNNGLCSHECVKVNGSAVCQCPDGFVLGVDNLTCDDIDECDDGNGGCSHNCENTIGSYRCSCREGHLEDGSGCVLIDKCSRGNGECSHICVTEGDTIKCECPNGFELHSDNKTCLCPFGYSEVNGTCHDIDECEMENGGCSHLCINFIGGFQCDCPLGYRLNSFKLCLDVNECELFNGNCSQVCVNTYGSYRCECIDGYHMMGGVCMRRNPCEDNNGGCDQICEDVEGRPVCDCQEGFKKNGAACLDVDECEGDHGCVHYCRNTIGSYECECKAGFRSNGKFCEDVDECSTDICGEKLCVNTIGSYRCVCRPGYKLQGGNCADIDECTIAKPCSGECVNTPGSYKCLCKTGYREDRGRCVDINECELDNGGCSHNCLNTAGSYRCLCPYGYEIQNQTCVDINECKIDNGGCQHDCTNTNGSYFCSCKEHYHLQEDKRACKVHGKFCNKLLPPHFGEIKCLQNRNLAAEFPPGSECYVKCYKGYKLDGDSQRICTADGEWSGRTGECIPLPCPKLKPPENGHFIPSSCTTGKSPPSHHCILACHKGYHVQGRAVLTCLNSQQWNRPVPKCGKDTPPPFIQCPPDIRAELPINKFTVHIKIPQPKSNVDWWTYVESHPPWAKQLEGHFPIGVTSIMFHARSPVSNLTAACRFQVHVLDNEKPRVFNCPQSFEVYMSIRDTTKIISWQEPTFTDNVRIEHVYKSREPGTPFRPGRHQIRYVASDPSGNQVSCHFTIAVRQSEPKSSPKMGRNFFKKIIVCPHLVAEAELMPSYLVSTRCFVQRHRLTRVLAEYPVQVYQHHRVRHHHDRMINSHRLASGRNIFPRRREFMKDEPKWHPPEKPSYQNTGNIPSSADLIFEIRGGLLNNSTITVDTHSLIDQKTHDSDLARWEDTVKKYHARRLPPLPDSHPGDDVRLLEHERRRQQEEERMKKHETEMRRWREEMRRYHMEIRRLQEDSRRFRLLRKILGPIKENDEYRRQHNNGLYNHLQYLLRP